MNNLIKTDTIFGKRANIVGNISADLVLESLGKIYIKSRNSAKTLEELITSLVTEDPNVSTSRTKIVEGIENLDTSEYKLGTFVFDKLSNILYLFIDDLLLPLINVTPEGTEFVKRSGDTMTGRLAIYVKNGPPLYVNSSDLVENLNAQYLNGETAESFTRRNADEKIGGKWTFKRPTTFESNTLFEKDIVSKGSIGSPNFAGGFGGYGWRMDVNSNTLTIDNLVVRKLMQVYELVVNKISATNGSLWVTNAGKVVLALKLDIKDNSFFTDTDECKKFCSGMPQGQAFVKVSSLVLDFTIDGKGLANAEDLGLPNNFLSIDTLRNAKLYVRTAAEETNNIFTFDDTEERIKEYSLFSEDFKFDCKFPIITRNVYNSQLREKNGKEPLQINEDIICLIYSYFKYFGNGDFYLVDFDDDSIPVFKPGDILRCQKWTYGGIKYYDGVVCNVLKKGYVIQLSPGFLDNKTVITYDSNLDPEVTVLTDSPNEDLYKTTNRKNGSNIGIIEEKDSLVLIGNLWNYLRLNAVYITSTDDGAPYIDTLSGVNRPDYSVIYYIPIYDTIKVNKSLDGMVPYTGDYYKLDEKYDTAEYAIITNPNTNTSVFTEASRVVSSIVELNGETITWLTTTPNIHSTLCQSQLYFNITWEDGGKILLDAVLDNEGQRKETGGCIILEEGLPMLQISSTRTTKVRVGNLDGIQDELFDVDKLPYGYGLYGQNVFLTGEFHLNNGTSIADIGKDAIAFAVAAKDATYNSLEILRLDRIRAENLLRNSVYSKRQLYSAGMYINNNALMVLWANQLLIVTRNDEFNGNSDPTALFENGKICGKFIQVHDIHSAWYSDSTSKLVAQVKLWSGNAYYYKEVLVYPKISGSEHIKDSEGRYLYYCEEDSSLVLTDDDVYEGYTEFGWHLRALGDGYLALKNISWDENGNLNLRGDIFVEQPYGIHILDNTGYNTLNITNNSVSTLINWTGGTSTKYIYFSGAYSNLNTINVDYYTLGIIHIEYIYLSNTTLTFKSSYTLRYTSGSRPSAIDNHIYIVLNFSDSTTRMYELYSGTPIYHNIGSTAVTSFYICVQGAQVDSLSGNCSYTSINLSSEIGANFMSYVTNNSNVFWFGQDGLKVSSIGAYGLVVDSGGVALINKSNTEPDLTSLADRLSLLNSESKYMRYDIFKALDDTLLVEVISNEYKRSSNEYMGLDINENTYTLVLSSSYQGETNILWTSVYFNPIKEKTIIVRPIDDKVILLLLYAGDDSRIGHIKNIIVEPGYEGEVWIAAYNGIIYSMNDNSDSRTYLNGNDFDISGTCWRIADFERTNISIIYLGKENGMNKFKIMS